MSPARGQLRALAADEEVPDHVIAIGSRIRCRRCGAETPIGVGQPLYVAISGWEAFGRRHASCEVAT